MIHFESQQHQQQNDDNYFKRIENNGDESNYAAMPGHITGASSIADQETDRSLGNEIDAGGSVVVSVPTIIRRDDDNEMTTDGNDSIYNPNYSIQSIVEVNLIIKMRTFFNIFFLVYSSKLSSTKSSSNFISYETINKHI